LVKGVCCSWSELASATIEFRTVTLPSVASNDHNEGILFVSTSSGGNAEITV
jgi:hypothetical protein